MHCNKRIRVGRLLVEFIDFLEEVPITPTGKPWQVYADGSSCRASEGMGVHIVIGAYEEHNNVIKLTFRASNNEPEYKTLLAKLATTRALGATKVEVRVDS